MKKIIKIKFAIAFMLLIGILFFIGLHMVNAELNMVKSGNCINLRVLSNCLTISLIEVSNNQTFFINSSMTHLGGQTFNYSFCNTSSLGIYTFSWDDPCIDCSFGGCGNSFTSTITGSDLTISKAVTYILIFVISFLIFVGLLLFGMMLPSKNNSDEMTGYIIAVSNLKYLKLLSLAFAYLVALFICFFSWNVSYNYLDISFITTIFQFLSIGLAVTLLPLFILGVYLCITNLIKDSKLSDYLSRGLKIQ